MEENIFNRYVELSTNIRMGESLSRVELDSILRETENLIEQLGYVPKRISYMLVNIPIDLEMAANYSKSPTSEIIQSVIADYLAFIDKILNDEQEIE